MALPATSGPRAPRPAGARGARPGSAATLPPGFQETVAFSGLTNPTAVRFAPDGRVFVAEKSGLIKVFDSLTRHDADRFADLSTNVHNFWDRGLLGLALDPTSRRARTSTSSTRTTRAIGGTAPRWGTPGVSSDPCPTPPGRDRRRLRRQRPALAPAGERAT